MILRYDLPINGNFYIKGYNAEDFEYVGTIYSDYSGPEADIWKAINKVEVVNCPCLLAYGRYSKHYINYILNFNGSIFQITDSINCPIDTSPYCLKCTRVISTFKFDSIIFYKLGRFLCEACFLTQEAIFCKNDACPRIAFGDQPGFCTRCLNGQLIRPYDHDVMTELNFIGNSKKGLYYGVEYEVKPFNIHDMAAKISKDFKGKALCVHDGSLRDERGEGLEIVTAPMTFDLQKQFQKEFFEKEYEYDSYNQKCCSTHVHMSRAAFSPLQLGKFKAFFHSHANKAFIEVIAGRDLTVGWGQRYANMSNDYKITSLVHKRSDYIYDETTGKPIKIEGKPVFYNLDYDYLEEERVRYSAVNCTNEDTIEIRIFRGCNKLSTMYKNLEFCKALYDFTNSSSVSVSKISDCVNSFTNYVERFKKVYPNLNKFIERHKVK